MQCWCPELVTINANLGDVRAHSAGPPGTPRPCKGTPQLALFPLLHRDIPLACSICDNSWDWGREAILWGWCRSPDRWPHHLPHWLCSIQLCSQGVQQGVYSVLQRTIGAVVWAPGIALHSADRGHWALLQGWCRSPNCWALGPPNPLQCPAMLCMNTTRCLLCLT